MRPTTKASVINTVDRIKSYLDKHKVSVKKVSALFKKYEETITRYQSKISGIPDDDNASLADTEQRYHIGYTDEIRSVNDLTDGELQDVYGEHWQKNIDKMEVLNRDGVSYYFINNLGFLHPLNQAIAKLIIDGFSFQHCFTYEHYFD